MKHWGTRLLLVLFLLVVALLGLVVPYATVGQAYSKGPAVYGGARLLWHNACGPGLSGRYLKRLLLLHLPTCLVFDTLLLPFAIVNEVRQGGVPVEGASLGEMGLWNSRLH